ncbi:MAG TPA: cytochrome c peroxidase [Bacteroidia bacterium]|nr:cytochrome c peroxidase [Bacteroidia bacterium]HNP98657.1 cytochrome c peroxidase [Bacteroidia bacterium]
MKLKLFTVFGFILSLCFTFYNCSDTIPDIKPIPVELNLVNNNQINSASQLGRVLFYDTHLSVNNSISCASCHKQALGFADNSAFSKGFENRPTLRNTLAIVNAATSSSFFWDGRENNLTTMVLKPIFNHVEMGMEDEDALVNRVRQLPYYYELFDKAYSTHVISAGLIANAIQSFLSEINSGRSKFELANGTTSNFTIQEARGKKLFEETYKCGSCHNDSLYGSIRSFFNIGLDVNYSDNGLGLITQQSGDFGKFKAPTLRNVAVTAPYMHDGRFATLHSVLDHYASSIAAHPNLEPILKDINGDPIRMNIPETDKQDIISFLNTMTDYALLSDPSLSNPFVIH